MGSRGSHDQPLLPGIDVGVEPFDGPGSQQGEIAGLGEDDLIHGLELAALDDGHPHVSSDVLAVGHHEELVALERLDTEGVQVGFGEPGHLGAGVDEDPTESLPAGPSARAWRPSAGHGSRT